MMQRLKRVEDELQLYKNQANAVATPLLKSQPNDQDLKDLKNTVANLGQQMAENNRMFDNKLTSFAKQFTNALYQDNFYTPLPLENMLEYTGKGSLQSFKVPDTVPAHAKQILIYQAYSLSRTPSSPDFINTTGQTWTLHTDGRQFKHYQYLIQFNDGHYDFGTSRYWLPIADTDRKIYMQVPFRDFNHGWVNYNAYIVGWK